MKSIIFSLSIVYTFSFVGTLQASSHKSTGPTFKVIGSSCVNPIWNEYPNYDLAKRNANKRASQICSPFQSRRKTTHRVFISKRCPSRFLGARATAIYFCLKDNKI